MALKKSELYSSLWPCTGWRPCRREAHRSYVLVLLFIKYVSDKYAGQPYAPITIPPGAGVKDMVALKGRRNMGVSDAFLDHIAVRRPVDVDDSLAPDVVMVELQRDRASERVAFDYFKRRQDQTYSAVDCLSFVVMEKPGLREALARTPAARVISTP